MRRDQLEHAIRTACQIVGRSEVIIVGSQAILGSVHERDLPAVATMSMEIDVLPIAPTNEETARLADQIEGEDLCVAKLCAFREKDREFVRALIDAGLVDRTVIVDRLPSVPHHHRPAADVAADWIATL